MIQPRCLGCGTRPLLHLVSIVFLLLATANLEGQTVDDLIKTLSDKGLLTRPEVDSLKALAAVSGSKTEARNHFALRMEYRPRTELRYGYQQLPADTSVPAFFTGQRTRLSVDYTFSDQLRAAFSMQDLRIWGSANPKGTGGTLQVFEAWAEPQIAPRWWLKVGRQRLVYDNQRLFAENNWRIGGASHDAAVLKYESPRLSVHLVGAFNQTSDRLFGTDFSPSDFTNYKSLVVNYIQYRYSEKLVFTAINAADGWQDQVNPEKINQRLTTGGRVEFNHRRLRGNVGAWFQFGRNAKGKKLSAWYLNPEVGVALPHVSFKAGVEVFSGNRPDETTTDHSFVPLFGSGHAFNGAMDLITRFPNDVGGAGLIDSYLVVNFPFSESFSVRATTHWFLLQNDWKNDDATYGRDLGMETDLLVSCKINPFFNLELGHSLASFTRTFVAIKQAPTGSDGVIPYFTYLSLIIKPTLLEVGF
jgi:hypothetical protein